MGWEPPIERIDLGNGQWWEVSTIVTRGMRKAVNRAAVAALPSSALAKADAGPEAVREAALADPKTLDLSVVEDAMLLAVTKAWSFPGPIALEVIDALPEVIVGKVLSRVNQIFANGSLTEEERERFFGRQSNAA